MLHRRFIASGCSCTQYYWPTWANYLGRHFTDYLNVAICGADNAVIARNVMQIAKPGDLVVVAWSGFDRWNNFYDNRQQAQDVLGDRLVADWSGIENLECGGWWHSGRLCHDQKWLVNHYHRIERFRNTLDYIKMVQMHSQILGYELWNFSMIDFFLGESEKKVDDRLVNMFQTSGIQHFYLRKDLNSLRDEIEPFTFTHKYSNGDNHPSPWVHWMWLKDHIAPEIGIELDQSCEDQVALDHKRVLKGDVE